jgi:uncharacterized membrane protein YdjX (TVP38/TMEM64 family)
MLPVSEGSAAKGALKRFWPLLAVAAGMGLVFWIGGHDLLTLENIVAQRDRFHGFLGQHSILALLTYVAFYAAAITLSIPCGLAMTVTGGLLFGWLVGGIAAVAGATAGATIVFLIARSAIGEGLSERMGPWIGKLREGFKEEALSYMLFLRLVPAFPFWFVNIAPALLGVPLRTYVIGTALGIIPATFAFATVGAGLDSVVMAAKNEYTACVALKGADSCALKIKPGSLLTKELILALVLLGFAALIPVVLKKWRRMHAAAK